ncbi:hypothetical protein RQN30_02235 [Arcanobacterium hippocoleae]
MPSCLRYVTGGKNSFHYVTGGGKRKILRKWWQERVLRLLPSKVLAFMLVTGLPERRLSRRKSKPRILPSVT